MPAPTVRIIRAYTLPNSREGRGRPRVEELVYEEENWQTVEEWAVEQLQDAGCTRDAGTSRYETEEPKIVDYSRGEEMTATALLKNFTYEQEREIYRRISG